LLLLVKIFELLVYRRDLLPEWDDVLGSGLVDLSNDVFQNFRLAGDLTNPV